MRVPTWGADPLTVQHLELLIHKKRDSQVARIKIADLPVKLKSVKEAKFSVCLRDILRVSGTQTQTYHSRNRGLSPPGSQ